MEANWNDQVGTSGYSKMPIQPLEYATKHGLTPALCNVLKYLLRDRGVCKLEDYAKMRDCIIKGKDLTIKYPLAYELTYKQLRDAIHGIFVIGGTKIYVWEYSVLVVLNVSMEENAQIERHLDLCILDIEDLEAYKHGYREATENESPDLDYTKLSGRKWVKIQKDV